jgi:2-desacetyl-2-hydroxyethyl bacteriochlorophyllide A dehydrogenase
MVEKYPMGMVVAPRQIAFMDRELRAPEVDEVLIAVRASSICGSDLHVFQGKHPSAALPSAIGHEIAGEVLQAGPEVSGLKIGDRVTVEPVVTCDKCHFCQRGAYHLCANISFQYRVGQGGFAPYFIVRERWAHRLPDHLSDQEGALIEPLAVAVHAVRQADIQPGHAVAIFGVGAIGLLVLQVARAAGAGPIFVIDVHEFRLAMARQLSAAVTFNNQEGDPLAQIQALTNSLGVDRAFEVVGLEKTLLQTIGSLRKGGKAVVLGIFEEPQVTLPANIFVQREITLTGSQGYNWDFQTALELAASGRVDLKTLITHQLPLVDLPQAFELIYTPPRETMKIVLTPT